MERGAQRMVRAFSFNAPGTSGAASASANSLVVVTVISPFCSFTLQAIFISLFTATLTARVSFGPLDRVGSQPLVASANYRSVFQIAEALSHGSSARDRQG